MQEDGGRLRPAAVCSLEDGVHPLMQHLDRGKLTHRGSCQIIFRSLKTRRPISVNCQSTDWASILRLMNDCQGVDDGFAGQRRRRVLPRQMVITGKPSRARPATTHQHICTQTRIWAFQRASEHVATVRSICSSVRSSTIDVIRDKFLSVDRVEKA